MADVYDTKPSEEPRPSTSDPWQEVGQQFQELGGSLAQAFRAAWEDEETRRQIREMKAGLESMVDEVGRAIKDTADSPTGQQLRSDSKKAAQSLRAAGEQTVQEVRPHLITALKDVNAALHGFVDRMEQRKTTQNQEPPEAPGV